MSDSNSQTIYTEIRELKELLDEVEESLKGQKEILQRRGMNLPPMVTRTVAAARTDLENVEKSLMDEQTELGQLRALATMSASINSSLDLDQVLEDAIDVVITLTQAERGYIILKNEETGELEFRISKDNELGQMKGDRGGDVQISMSIVNDVMASGKPMLTDNAYKDERLQGNLSVANFALRSVICSPLNYKGETIGVLYVDNRLRSGIFGEREKNMLTGFANTAAVALANARMFANVQELLHEISDAQELMDNVFRSIGSGVIATNADDLVTIFNDAAEIILEREANDTIGKNLRYVLPKITADLDDHLSAIRENHESQIIAGELDAKRGRIAINMMLTPLQDAEKNTQGVAVVVDDVTEQLGRELELSVMKRLLPPQLIDQIHTISNLALGGERREVTCLFVDVRPLATLPQDMRPVDLMKTLQIYLAVGTDCIHKNEGIIDKYMGNEIMVLFNTQLNPMEDHAARAVYTALQMREEFIKLYAELGISPDPHFYRMGMHTGVATLGNVGSLNRREFTAIGDTINLSKRLEENASEQQIIVSETTRLHMEQVPGADNFSARFEEREPIKVKGRQQSTRIYEVFQT